MEDGEIERDEERVSKRVEYAGSKRAPAAGSSVRGAPRADVGSAPAPATATDGQALRARLGALHPKHPALCFEAQGRRCAQPLPSPSPINLGSNPDAAVRGLCCCASSLVAVPAARHPSPEDAIPTSTHQALLLLYRACSRGRRDLTELATRPLALFCSIAILFCAEVMCKKRHL